MLSLESAITIAYFRGKLSSQMVLQQGTPRGAMLAVGLSAEDVQPYIEDVSSGKATVACINSPRSVTLSGDVNAIHDIHCRLEEKQVFSRKLRVNVAYHSAHMKAIADEYSRSLRGLNVRPRHKAVKFYSSVFPGISAETNIEYWVQNILSPVRFSEAMKIVLESQTERDLACIEIGPHSALAGPFKQICQSLPEEARTEYIPSMLRKENGVEQALRLACNLFNQGWKIAIARINFPVGHKGLRVLTDLPPYSWNHSTNHWHEGRLSHNHRYRTNPPHSILGTLLDDSSDIDMRWTKYIRLSELPWLKDHVVRSEVLLPGAAYLAMAIEAVNQKSSIYGIEVQGYTVREVTFSRVLVVPDTADGVEVSFILEPFRQSSVAASATWNEFRVISFGPDRKAYEHCHGLISGSQQSSFDFSSTDQATLSTMIRDKAMRPGLYKRWLSQTGSGGTELGPSFQLVSECCMNGEDVFCTLGTPDTAGCESPLTTNVPLMDCVLQVAVLALAGKSHPLDGAIIPTSIAELVISASMGRDPGLVLRSRGSTAELGPRDFDGQVIVAQERNDLLHPVVQVKGARFVCIARDQDSGDTMAKLCWDILWDEDPDDLSQEGVARHWPIGETLPHEVPQMIMCERAAWYCLRSAYMSLTESDMEKMAPHHRKFYNWMEKRFELGRNGHLPFQKSGRLQEWACAEEHVVENVLQQASTSGAQGRMTVRVGRRLLDVLRGEVDPLSLMLEDDLLNQYYAESRGQDRVYEQVGRFMRLAGHKNPELKILEIGAGTGYVFFRLFLTIILRDRNLLG